jgi:hypothetical protein
LRLPSAALRLNGVLREAGVRAEPALESFEAQPIVAGLGFILQTSGALTVEVISLTAGDTSPPFRC